MGVFKFMGDDESVMFRLGKVWASCCINYGETAGSIYSNNGRGAWQRGWEVMYETPYILPARPGQQTERVPSCEIR